METAHCSEVFLHAPVPMALADRACRMREMNQALVELLGDGARLLGADLSCWLVDLSPERVGWTELFSRTRAALDFDGTVLRSAGETTPARVQASLIQDPHLDEPLAVVAVRLSPARVELQTVHRLLDRMTDGFVALDRAWRVTYVNQTAFKHFRFAKDGLIGRPVWEVFPYATGVLERDLRRAALGVEPVVEVVAPVLDRWFQFRIFGGQHGLSVYFTDVSAQHQARDALRESEARYRSIFENSREGMLLTEGARIVQANRAACTMLERTEPELLALGADGLHALVALPPAPTNATPTASTSAGGQSEGPTVVPVPGAGPSMRPWSGPDPRLRVEVRLRRRDGTEFPAELAAEDFQDMSGNVRSCLSFHDLTERKRWEARLQLLADAGVELGASLDAQVTLRTLTRLVTPGLADACTVDLLDGRFVARVAVAHQDPAQEWMLGEPRRAWPPTQRRGGVDAVLRTGEPELVPAVTEAYIAGLDDPLLKRRAHQLGITSLLRVPLRWDANTIGVLSLKRMTGGRPFTPADLQIAFSVADRAALAIVNSRLYGEALTAARMRDEVLAVVSHDLRSPMTSIALASARLLRQPLSDTKPAESIRRAASRANRLIEDLLTAAKIDAGGLSVERQDADVLGLIAEVMDVHRPLADEKGIELRSSIHTGVSTAFLDRHRMIQLLSNLLGNALKFTPPQGTIVLSAHQIGGELRLGVSDTGPGIAETELPHLFDRFWQGAHAKRAGAGLGLAICKGIAEAHGGTIQVLTEIGKGTIFLVVLPDHPPRARAVEHPEPVAKPVIEPQGRAHSGVFPPRRGVD